jgi:hypothetical protein
MKTPFTEENGFMDIVIGQRLHLYTNVHTGKTGRFRREYAKDGAGNEYTVWVDEDGERWEESLFFECHE